MENLIASARAVGVQFQPSVHAHVSMLIRHSPIGTNLVTKRKTTGDAFSAEP